MIKSFFGGKWLMSICLGIMNSLTQPIDTSAFGKAAFVPLLSPLKKGKELGFSVGGVVADYEFFGCGDYYEVYAAEELYELAGGVGEARECVVVLVICFVVHDGWFLFGEITLYFCKREGFQ